ncbi:putative UspA domain protein [Desulfosarcina cetonica]|uniref:universal stress protein n=1 Tax=Desulfosarcina cetonica TaxID=90730 RepID=UPI0006D275C6|nr:universal stress protein [Desulfosarcina cetonica]VTR67269.1 putative UspA domain protein [Desulfosarcina cetonica]
METFNNILVVSRSTKKCIKVLQTGIDLARGFNAKLHLLHIVPDPINFGDWNMQSMYFDREYESMVANAREELDALVKAENAQGLVVSEWVKGGDPITDIEEAVKTEKVDLILLRAHKQGRLEHLFFGRINDAVIRRLPATVLLVD